MDTDQLIEKLMSSPQLSVVLCSQAIDHMINEIEGECRVNLKNAKYDDEKKRIASSVIEKVSSLMIKKALLQLSGSFYLAMSRLDQSLSLLSLGTYKFGTYILSSSGG